MVMKLVLHAEKRIDLGTSNARRLRRDGDSIPGVVYGGGQDTDEVIFSRRELVKLMEQEIFFSHAVTLYQGEAQERVILRDLQRHPATGDVLHLDFMRISSGRAVHVRIPLHFINEDQCVGVRTQGGNILHAMTEVEVHCLPDAIPDFIAVDLQQVNVREAIHLSDLSLPEGVNIVALQHDSSHDLPVASVQSPRGGLEDEAEETEEETTEEEFSEDAEVDKK